jgi:uncharacterized protein involved in exopolysaccharide biosynthesis
MLISEFIDRTGFRPTEDYYHTVIEPEYNASDLEKDAWCKQWKKNGGIQKAYDALKEQAANEYANVLSLENEVKKLKEMNDNQSQVIRDEREKSFELSQTLDNAMSDLNAAQEREQSMMYELLEISEKYSSAELREIVINAIGFKEYISYKFEHDMAIWQLDRDKIIENLK